MKSNEIANAESGLWSHPARQAFLELVPERNRSLVTNSFLAQVREGKTDLLAIIGGVIDKLEAQIPVNERNGEPERVARNRELIRILRQHRPQAVQFAAWAKQYEATPKADRDACKEERAQEHMQRWMTERQPTEKQIAYLRSLGHRGENPQTMAEASALIDRLRKRRG